MKNVRVASVQFEHKPGDKQLYEPLAIPMEIEQDTRAIRFDEKGV
jgi:hypothetical protein